MRSLLADLENIVGVYKFHVEKVDDEYYIVDREGYRCSKAELVDDMIDIRFIYNADLFHFTVIKGVSNTIVACYRGTFCVNNLMPVEEYRITKTPIKTTYNKTIYTHEASKKFELLLSDLLSRSSVEYELGNYVKQNKMLIRTDENSKNQVGVYESIYGKKDKRMFNYIARIDDQSLSICEMDDDEYIRNSPIGKYLNKDEISRCIKSFVSSKQCRKVAKEVIETIPKSLQSYFNKNMNRFKNNICSQEDVPYINEFFRELDGYDILSSSLPTETKEKVVRLVRCEF